MRSHLQEYAHDLVARHGPRTAAQIRHAFTNVGNYLPGAGPDEQMAFVVEQLKADDRLSFDGDNPGLSGGMFSHKENHHDDPDE